ncbi:MAG TPA: lytic transglycosylase domain-containing protein [Bacillales bacterium]|nr:lytic transglycosylase domain-containing protein [Bacillales bacterium]
MLTFLKKTWLYQILMLLIVVMAIDLAAVHKRNRQLKDEFHKGIQTAALRSAVQMDSMVNPSNTKNAYHKWLCAEKMAKHFYQTSDGKFKTKWGLFLVLQARGHQIDPKIVFQLLKLESGGTFNPHLIGPKTKYGRAYGMAQFMTNTAPWIAKMAHVPYKKKKLFDPYYAIDLSVTYLDFLHDRYGNWNEALTAYNRGIYGLKSYMQKHGDSKSDYAMTIQNRVKKANVHFVFGH